MKLLRELNEARYAGQHPVIKWIYEVFERKEPHASHQFNSVEDALQVRDLVIAEFGQPDDTDTDEWNYSEWMIDYKGDRIQVEIGHGNRGPHAPGPDADIEILNRAAIGRQANNHGPFEGE